MNQNRPSLDTSLCEALVGAARSARQGNSMDAPFSRRAMPVMLCSMGASPPPGGAEGRSYVEPRELAALARTAMRTAFACVRPLRLTVAYVSRCRRVSLLQQSVHLP